MMTTLDIGSPVAFRDSSGCTRSGEIVATVHVEPHQRRPSPGLWFTVRCHNGGEWLELPASMVVSLPRGCVEDYEGRDGIGSVDI